ncbi:MAG: SRPBCC domain-containing protein [Ignavibacteria bacterium]
MTEKNFNNESFFHSIYLNAPLSVVYKIIASPGGIEKWFMGKAVYTDISGKVRQTDAAAQKGDTFSWHWLEKDLSITGKVLEADINENFSFTFGPTFEVTISVKEDNGRTLLTLSQKYTKGAEKNDFAHLNCCTCWVFFLTNLKSVIEHGQDLRETLVNDESLVNR